MTTTQLHVFVTVAQTQSFTRAAIFLDISQSAVSHAIRSLEEELGVILLTRGKSLIGLTSVGHSILSKAHQALGLFEAIEQEACQAKNLQKGVLKIGSFGPSFSAGLLPAILQEFNRRYPQIQVHIEEAEDQVVRQWIIDRKVDLGSIILPDKGLQHIHLAMDNVLLVLPRTHPLNQKPHLKLADCADSPFILTKGSTGQIMMDRFRQAKLSVNILYSNMQIMSMLSMVSNGAGISATAELSIPTSQSNEDRPYALRAITPALTREIGLAAHSMDNLSPAASAFVALAGQLQRQGKLASVLNY